MDVESIPLGSPFPDHVKKELKKSDVFLIIIDKQWLYIQSNGKRRLDDPQDWVRHEVEFGLSSGLPVIPVLIEGTSMPKAHELPESLKGLANRNALVLSHSRMKGDVDRLVDAIGPIPNRPSNESKGVVKETHGDKSPIVDAEGNVNIHYINKHFQLDEKQFDLLTAQLRNALKSKASHHDRIVANFLDQIDTKDKSIYELEAEVQSLSILLDSILANKNISPEIKALIEAGDIDAAEALVDKHYEDQLLDEKKSLAQKLYERGQIKELKLKYADARQMYIEAATLIPENTIYLNQAGSILHELSEYDEAISYFEQALVSDLNTFGEDHPNVARDRNNLGGAWYAKASTTSRSSIMSRPWPVI